MGDEIKSAFEKAMERAEKLGRASPEEMKKAEWFSKGNMIGAKYLQQDIKDLAMELSKIEEDVRMYVDEGLDEVLRRNIDLPKNGFTRDRSQRALEGILALKENNSALKEAMDQIGHLFAYYEQAMQQMQVSLRQEFEGKLADAMGVMAQQFGTRNKMDLHRHPQFQEQLRQAVAGLDAQYVPVLNDLKQRLAGLK